MPNLRKEYSEKARSNSFDESTVPKEPFSLFEQWLATAIETKMPETNAMCLCTVGADGKPSGRMVLMKSFDQKGFVWFTNYESRKSN